MGRVCERVGAMVVVAVVKNTTAGIFLTHASTAVTTFILYALGQTSTRTSPILYDR